MAYFKIAALLVLSYLTGGIPTGYVVVSGKGVATSAGVFAALLPVPMGLTIGAFILAVSISGHISVGSMSGAVVLPLAAALLGAPPYFTAAAAGAGALILCKHIPNLKRLLQNKELGIHGPSA